MLSETLSGEATAVGPRVHVYVASFNTARSTELCVRSMWEYAGYPFQLTVGDSGSKDGSLALLEACARQGWLELEVAGRHRVHAEWLDHWRRSAQADLALFVDSDIEFRASGWLRDLVAAAVDHRAALIFTEMQPEVANFVEPVGRATVRVASRPAPWLLMFDVARTAGLDVPFEFGQERTDRVPEGIIVYDVGGLFFRAVQASGLGWAQMPDTFRAKYHHYGGLSWSQAGVRRRLRKWFDLKMVDHRLRQLRRRQLRRGS